MFDISLIRRLTLTLNKEYYFSPQSTFEYILYNDIEIPEIYIDEDVELLLMSTQMERSLTYDLVDGWYHIRFRDFGDYIKMKKMNLETVQSKIANSPFNYGALAIVINNIDLDSYKERNIQNKMYYAHLLDPYNQYQWLKKFYIQVIDLKAIITNGKHIYEMVHYMSNYKLDLSKDAYADLLVIKNKINYPHINFKDTIFDLFKSSESHKFWDLLKDLNALKVVNSLLSDIDEEKFWTVGISALKRVEAILKKKDYFQEYVCRGLHQNLITSDYGGYSKIQLLKFSMLFYHGHRQIQLEPKAYFIPDSPLGGFCKFFHLKKEACLYYAHVVESSQNSKLNFKDALIKKELLSMKEIFDLFKKFDDHTIDILLIQYVYQTLDVDHLSDMVIKEKFEELIICYLSTYCDLKSINSELSTLEIKQAQGSDEIILKLIDEVKEGIFLGELEYNRDIIIKYIQDKLDIGEN